jgi:hypothetical protein
VAAEQMSKLEEESQQRAEERQQKLVQLQMSEKDRISFLLPKSVVVVALVEKNTTKTQLSTNWAVCSMKNTSFSQSRI